MHNKAKKKYSTCTIYTLSEDNFEIQASTHTQRQGQITLFQYLLSNTFFGHFNTTEHMFNTKHKTYKINGSIMAVYNGFEMCPFHSPVLEEYTQLQIEQSIPKTNCDVETTHIFLFQIEWSGIIMITIIVIPFTKGMLHATTLKCYQNSIDPKMG